MEGENLKRDPQFRTKNQWVKQGVGGGGGVGGGVCVKCAFQSAERLMGMFD